MKPEKADRLLNAFERAAVALSDQPTAELAIREVTRALVLLLAALRKARSRESLRRELLAIDEELSEREIIMVEAAARYAPKLGLRWIRKAARHFLLTYRETGRPEAIAPEKHPEVVRKVVETMRRKRTFVQARESVAEGMGVSSRTIQRIWLSQHDAAGSEITQEEAEMFLSRLYGSVASSAHDAPR